MKVNSKRLKVYHRASNAKLLTYEQERKDLEEATKSSARESEELAFFCLPKHDEKMLAQRRRLWIIEGVLKHNINEDLLCEVVCNFKRIGRVPHGYDYPQLHTIKQTSV